MDKCQKEKNEKEIVRAKLKIVASIINSQGKATSFDYGNCGSYSRYFDLLYRDRAEGDGITLSSAIRSSLPFGVSAHTERVKTDKWKGLTGFEKGYVRLNIVISEGYASKKYNEMKRKMSPMISGMKQNGDIINKFVEFIRGYGDNLSDHYICVDPSGVVVDKGDCKGEGIWFSKFGMKKLDSIESMLALAYVIVESLNTEENKYTVFADVGWPPISFNHTNIDYTYINLYIQLIHKDEPDPKLKSWY